MPLTCENLPLPRCISVLWSKSNGMSLDKGDIWLLEPGSFGLIVTQAMPPLTLNIIFCRNPFLQTTCQVFTLVVVEYLMKVMSERYLNSKIGNMHVSCLVLFVHDP